MNTAELLMQAIEQQGANAQGTGFRYHLGASIIGRTCVREIWYKFRWWHAVRHTGRMLRLFGRGHAEEPRVVAALRNLGAIVKDRNDDGSQTRYSHLWGLFGGEQDSEVSNLEEFGLVGRGLLEIKTHNDKSFNNLKTKGLLSAKPEHFIQMQMYMGWAGYDWGLYWAVNKNDDEVYIAVIPRRPAIAEQYTDRAEGVLRATTPPPRINNDATWWQCRFCDFKRHCHEHAAPAKNCRTCVHVQLRLGPDPLDTDGHAWYCSKWRANIPTEVTREGCDQWRPLEE